MYSGQITVEGDSAVPGDVLQEAIRYGEQVRSLKEASGLSQLTKAFDLANGYQAYVVDLAHVRTIHIVPPRPSPLYDWPALEPTGEIPIAERMPIIGFVSGAAETGIGEFVDEGVRVLDARVGLMRGGASSTRTAELFSAHEVALKVGVLQSVTRDEIPRTQLHSIQPGRFTGAMASVVQLLLGVGKVSADDYESRYLEREELAGLEVEELQLTSGGEILHAELVEDVETLAPSFYDEEEVNEVQLQLDYRWNRTHGILWGTRHVTDAMRDQAVFRGMPASMVVDPDRDREPFMVELSQRGVLATPLPRDEASFFEEVRAQYRTVYPELEKYKPFWNESTGLFEALGGFPTGEAMPQGEELDRLIRAGLVLEDDEVLDDFYEGLAYTTSHGWAFADNQPRAINTCYKLENGARIGYCYEVVINITQRAEVTLNPLATEVVFALNLTDFIDVYKAGRLTDEQARSVLRSGSYAEFDELEVEADWTMEVEMHEVTSGPIDHPSIICNDLEPCNGVGPQYKVWEPALEILMTFDFYNPVPANHPHADGPIFATYVADHPEILSFYSDTLEVEREDFDARQQCQYVGTWESGHYYKRQGVTGSFYTTTVDPRIESFYERGDIRVTKAREIGRADHAATCGMFGRELFLERHVFGTESWEGRRWSGSSYNVSAVCSSNNRSAFFMAVRRIDRDVVEYSGFSGRNMWGRTGGRVQGSLYNFAAHWWGSCMEICNATSTFMVCNRFQVPSCFGPEYPSELEYSVEGGSATNPLVVTSPTGALIIDSAYYTPTPKAPGRRSERGDLHYEVDFKIYGMGLPEMNGRLLKHEEWSRDDVGQVDGSNRDWWRCSLPDCPVVPWPVLRNYFGAPFVKTSEEFGDGVVEYGKQPSIDIGADAILFGVVD